MIYLYHFRKHCRWTVRAVKLNPVRRTPKRRLWQVDFVFEGNGIRGLEQNPQTKSRWAQMARSGKKAMQFISEGRYVANVVDGKVTFYGRGERKNQGMQ